MVDRVARVTGPAQDGDGARVGALGDVGARQRAPGHQALGEDEHAGAARDPGGVGGDGLRQRAGGHGEDHEVVVVELDVRGGAHGHRRGQLDVAEVALVAARDGELGGLLGRAAGEVDLDAGPGERDGHARAPRPGAQDCGATDRRQPAQPLPLQRDARPDALGDRGGEVPAGLLDAREGQRAADADAHLVRADAPAAADGLGADDGDGHDRHAGLEREAPDAALGLAERARADPGALGEDDDDVAALQDLAGRGHRVLVGVAAVDREGAERVEDPRLPALAEQLLLGDEVDRPPHERADHEGIQERPVVGGDDEGALGRDVLAPEAGHPEVEVEERLQHAADDPVDDRVGPTRARALQI